MGCDDQKSESYGRVTEPTARAGVNTHSLLSRNNDKITIFRDRSGEYRWKRVASNGKSIAVSGEGFKNWQDAFDICQSLFPTFPVVVDIAGTGVDV